MPTSEEEQSENTFDGENCSYCGRTCSTMARCFESRKFCSNTCARLFGIPKHRRRSSNSSGIGGKTRGGWKNYFQRRNNVTSRKIPRVSMYWLLVSL